MRSFIITIPFSSRNVPLTLIPLVPKYQFEKWQFILRLILFQLRCSTKTQGTCNKPTWTFSLTYHGGLRGHRRVYISNRSSENIKIIAAEHFRFLMQTQQILRSLADRRAPPPPRSYMYNDKAIHWPGAGMIIITGAMPCSVWSNGV